MILRDPEEMYERERNLRRLIAECRQRHMQQFCEETAAWVQELSDIEACKPPKPVLVEGHWYVYTGPRPLWTPNGLDMSEYGPRPTPTPRARPGPQSPWRSDDR